MEYMMRKLIEEYEKWRLTVSKYPQNEISINYSGGREFGNRR